MDLAETLAAAYFTIVSVSLHTRQLRLANSDGWLQGVLCVKYCVGEQTDTLLPCKWPELPFPLLTFSVCLPDKVHSENVN